MDRLDRLENGSIYILREAYSEFRNLCMLWSIGKDSTVLLWLTRKAFFGHVPVPLIHIDTSFKIPAMISYRDLLALEWRLTMIYGQNSEALQAGATGIRQVVGLVNKMDLLGYDRSAFDEIVKEFAAFMEQLQVQGLN